jgi:hypothetical protein
MASEGKLGGGRAASARGGVAKRLTGLPRGGVDLEPRPEGYHERCHT